MAAKKLADPEITVSVTITLPVSTKTWTLTGAVNAANSLFDFADEMMLGNEGTLAKLLSINGAEMDPEAL